MYCINCGKEIQNETAFCTICGAKQEVNDSTVASVTTVGNNKIPGRRMLKVVGIISIVFASLAILGGLGDLVNPYAKQLEMISLGLPSWYAAYLTATNIVLGGLMLTMGILGVVWCTKKEKAGKLAVLAIIVLAILPITFILGIIEGNLSLVSVGAVTIIFNSVLPILFLIGAIRRKNSQV